MSSFEDYYYKNIAKQVRKYREINGFTQEELSDKLSKNLKYIGHIERGERRMSNSMLIVFMETLKIQPSEFYAFEKYKEWKQS